VPAAEDDESCAVLLARANDTVKSGKPGGKAGTTARPPQRPAR
jgi:hypothetical protein